ncbi:MAG: Rap1a/Tai family immunity protein, partial [bacterium]|nr:Rap1a/Tai family immunity protein [bacterium]
MPHKIVSMEKVYCILILTLSMNFILITPSTSPADGKKLLTQCETIVAYKEGKDISNLTMATTEEAIYCLGYIQGTLDMNHFYEISIGDNAMFCMPEKKLNNMEATKIVIRYLREHPEGLK